MLPSDFSVIKNLRTKTYACRTQTWLQNSSMSKNFKFTIIERPALPRLKHIMRSITATPIPKMIAELKETMLYR